MSDRLDAVRDFLRKATYKREHVDRFLDPDAPMWARFDPVLGYTLRTFFDRDGVDGCWTLQSYEPAGNRRMVNFAGQPCRINTYGDSFTQGAQVSDGETWQEILAAHLLEPVRNFGIGGQGVYHAWLRMKEKESQPGLAAPCVILNMWGDDHQRSINAWRWLTYSNTWEQANAVKIFHGNPWAHARLDPATGELVEHPNPFNTPESLYRLCDPDFVIETFIDDPVVRILVALQMPAELDCEPIRALGATVGLTSLDFSNPQATLNSAWWVYNVYATRVTMRLMETRILPWVRENGKQLLVLLSYPEPSVREICEGKQRDEVAYLDWHPRMLREHLDSLGVRYVDTLPAHLAEFATFRLSPQDYTNRYYIGHYNPAGNQFFARAIKDPLVGWLDPKPPAYQGGLEQLVRFKGYLPG